MIKKLILITIGLILLTGCSNQEATNNELYKRISEVRNRVGELEKTVIQTNADTVDFMETRIRIMLLQKDGYSWEQEGIKFTAEVKNACISTADIWQATPIPFGFANVPTCEELSK